MAEQLSDALTQLVKVSRPIRLTAAVFGSGLALAGAAAVFVTANSAGAASLVIAGTAVGTLAMFADSVQSVKAGNFELVLTAAKLRTAAQDAERKGRSEEAEVLRGQAELLLLAAQPVASAFERVRQEMSPGPERTVRQESLIKMAREAAHGFSDDAGPAVEKLFDAGTDGQRIFAIGVMQGKPKLASTRVVETALKDSHTAFEQFQALVLALEMVKHDPESKETRLLRSLIEQMRAEGKFADGTDRGGVARRILDSALPPNSSEQSNRGAQDRNL
jgi:hypothetical protein